MTPHEVDSAMAGDGEAVREAYRFVDQNVKTADGFHGAAPWWHGWMVRTAFLAGVVWEKARNKKAKV